MSELRRIANSIGLQLIGAIQRPNDIVNNSIINANSKTQPQVDFLKASKIRDIIPYNNTEHVYEIGRGEKPIPVSNDFYMGEVL